MLANVENAMQKKIEVEGCSSVHVFLLFIGLTGRSFLCIFNKALAN